MRKIVASLSAVLMLARRHRGGAGKDEGATLGPATRTWPRPAGAKPDAAVIAKATSAAPPDIGRNAAVMGMGGRRQDEEAARPAPMGGCACSISSATQCASTRSGRPGATRLDEQKDPSKPKTVGVAYMLKGDKGASNTDPVRDESDALTTSGS